ncbi:TRM11 family SAM-dependent methyltransferase [Paenibacillus sp. strain BS8-2]
MRLYTYACHEDEAELCALELSTLLGRLPAAGIIVQEMNDGEPAVDVSRSPFLKRRIDVERRAVSLERFSELLAGYDLAGQTFKIYYTDGDESHTYEERREYERQVGGYLRGRAEMRYPDVKFGLMRYQGEWLWGPSTDNAATWLLHQAKPQNYSTALPTRAARALVNIAAGANPAGLKLIDPCCGMGTVLIEALSMGIDAEGVELNPLAARGARLNLEHFGYTGSIVTRGDMLEWTRQYDTAILDMPYNLCSVLPSEEQLAMLRALKRMTNRAVVVTTEDIGTQLAQAGFRMMQQAKLSKGTFTRYISVVE